MQRIESVNNVTIIKPQTTLLLIVPICGLPLSAECREVKREENEKLTDLHDKGFSLFLLACVYPLA